MDFVFLAASWLLIEEIFYKSKPLNGRKIVKTNESLIIIKIHQRRSFFNYCRERVLVSDNNRKYFERSSSCYRYICVVVVVSLSEKRFVVSSLLFLSFFSLLNYYYFFLFKQLDFLFVSLLTFLLDFFYLHFITFSLLSIIIIIIIYF